MRRGATFEAAGATVEYVRSRRILRVSTAGRNEFSEVAPGTLLRELGIDLAELAPACQYLLFAGSNDSPTGGLGDLVGVLGNEADAREAFRRIRLDRSARRQWAELAALDAGGRLRRVCWFGREVMAPRDGALLAGPRRPRSVWRRRRQRAVTTAG